ncbi:hypothetical protein J3E73DRAFT_376371 [Bipolaris maydis]|nr:hypothetical protein J3E73DRAFT_376371 [Bipolaris maydis]
MTRFRPCIDLHAGSVKQIAPATIKQRKKRFEAWKGGMQVGGGITEQNAAEWIAKGADKVSGICVIGPRNEGLSIDPEANGSAVESIALLEPHCSEFLIHAADVEGLQRGIDHELVAKLAEWCSIPVTYAGGGHSLDDLELVKKLSNGKVDLTIGSALDIFGGSSVKFEDCVKWNTAQQS